MTPELRAAFRTRLLTVTGLPAVAWENRNFTPPNNAAWIEERLLPAPSKYAAFGGNGISNGTIKHSGIYQITLIVPAGSDTKAAETLVDTLVSLFRPGVRLTLSTGEITTCTLAYPSPPIQDGTGYRIPISIYYDLYRLNT